MQGLWGAPDHVASVRVADTQESVLSLYSVRLQMILLLNIILSMTCRHDKIIFWTQPIRSWRILRRGNFVATRVHSSYCKTIKSNCAGDVSTLTLRVDDLRTPAYSPDLTFCDFYFCSYLYVEVFKHRPRTLQKLKVSNVGEIVATSPS